jgi:uncharacterized protein YciI
MEQPEVADHAAFMNTLADEGLVLLAGPLAGAQRGLLRALLIIDAEDKAELTRRLADDPWSTNERLKITSIEPWNVVVRARRLSATIMTGAPT